MPFIVSPPPPTANQSLTPYIANVQGVALVGQSSKIEIKGINFNSDSQLICNLGVVSNIQKTPESITFDILATAPGSTPIEIRNGGKSSIDWGVSTPILIARNSLNITNGWIDFRTANSNNFGTVTSHINATNSVKTFTNSGYGLDPVRGLIFSNPINTANSFNNFIQFDNFSFPSVATIYEIIVFMNTYSNLDRIKFGCGIYTKQNAQILNCEAIINYLVFTHLFEPSIFDLKYLRNPNDFPASSEFILKVKFNFESGLIQISRMIGLSDFDASDFYITTPMNIRQDNLDISYSDISVVPLINFYNTNSLSSIVAMRIE